MATQSRTYNGGTILEYIFNVVPVNGNMVSQNVFILIATGEIINPKSRIMQVDVNSENAFRGVCCTTAIDEICEGWSTINGNCWITDDNVEWAFV